MSKRRRFSGDAEGEERAPEAASWRPDASGDVASKHQVHPNQVSTWKRQIAIDGLGEVRFRTATASAAVDRTMTSGDP